MSTRDSKSKKTFVKKSVPSSIPISEEIKTIGTWKGDDYQMEDQDWPSYVLLKGQSYQGVGKRRAPKRDICVDQVHLTISGKTLLSEETKFEVISGVKYGIIGRNGLGKSVLMSKLSRREEPFQNVPEYINILYIEQEIQGDERTPLQAVIESNRELTWLLEEDAKFKQDDVSKYDYIDIQDRLKEIDYHTADARARKVLYGLGFSNEEMIIRKTKEYSGGWRMRIALACALFGEPDLLILDEPTNHLDISAVIWLEDYLCRWKKSLLLISHDRDFLDGIIDSVIHLHNKTLTYYKGNCQSFVKGREMNQRALINKKDAIDREIKKKEKIVRENRDHKKAKKDLASLKPVNEDVDDPSLVFRFLNPNDIKDDTSVISIKDVSYGYSEEKMIFQSLELAIYMDSRIALVGSNGVGKSTFLKLLDGTLTPTTGQIHYRKHLRIARFHQHHTDQLDLNKSSLDYFQSKFNTPQFEIRGHLARFGIKGDLALKQIRDLSGGQKSRVSIAELAYLSPHVLLLDEPTNHLDMESIDSLVEGISNFKGAVVIIFSHNQYLIEKASNTLWVVKGNNIKRYNGDFGAYKQEIINKF